MQFIEQQLGVFCNWICIALNPAFCVETDSESIETISEDEAMSFPSHPLASFCYVSGTSSSIIYNLSLVCLCLCRCVYRYIVIDSYKLRIVCSVSNVEFDWFWLMTFISCCWSENVSIGEIQFVNMEEDKVWERCWKLIGLCRGSILIG